MEVIPSAGLFFYVWFTLWRGSCLRPLQFTPIEQIAFSCGPSIEMWLQNVFVFTHRPLGALPEFPSVLIALHSVLWSRYLQPFYTKRDPRCDKFFFVCMAETNNKKVLMGLCHCSNKPVSLACLPRPFVQIILEQLGISWNKTEGAEPTRHTPRYKQQSCSVRLDFLSLVSI